MEYSIVIPVYNSGDWLMELVDRIILVMQEYQSEYEILLINDASPKGNVWPAIIEIGKKYPWVKGINLLYNHGQFIATICGLETSNGNYVITMDDDFQHLPEELPKLIAKIRERNYDCVFGVFEERKHSLFRRVGSSVTNKIVGRLYNRPTGIQSNSLRIMTRRLADTVVLYKTAFPQISPIIFMCTKNIGNVLVYHEERKYGRSGYGVKKLVSETVNSIINVSTLPLDMVSIIGITSSALSFLIGFVYLIMYLTGHITVPGFTAQILVTVFFSGFILFSIGIVGKYIGRIIKEITGLPRYIIKDSINLTIDK